jgi:hypothetical protein
MQSNSVSAGQQLALSNATVTWVSASLRKATGEPSVIELAVEIASGIGVGVISNWLYEKLKGRHVKLRINRVEVEHIDKDSITRVIVEQTERH